jgi:hypothetical protein
MFCPTCQAADGEAASQEQSGTGETPDQGAETTDSTGNTGQETETTGTTPAAKGGDTRDVGPPTEAADRTGGDGATRQDTAGSQSDPTPDASTPRERTTAPRERDGRDLATAERDLETALARFARRGAETEDPRSAREHLKTAREAAEALAALRQ